jgi:hypothetical protein
MKHLLTHQLIAIRFLLRLELASKLSVCFQNYNHLHLKIICSLKNYSTLKTQTAKVMAKSKISKSKKSKSEAKDMGLLAGHVQKNKLTEYLKKRTTLADAAIMIQDPKNTAAGKDQKCVGLLQMSGKLYLLPERRFAANRQKEADKATLAESYLPAALKVTTSNNDKAGLGLKVKAGFKLPIGTLMGPFKGPLVESGTGVQDQSYLTTTPSGQVSDFYKSE